MRRLCSFRLAVAVSATGLLVCGLTWAQEASGSKANPAKKGGGRGTVSCTFDDQKVGALPAGWITATSGSKGKAARWEVAADATAPSAPQVLALTKAENGDKTVNLVLADGPARQDVDLSVKVKANPSQKEGTSQKKGSCGVVWRVQDSNNFYAARWSPISKSLRVYCVRSGALKALASAKVQADPNAWHTIQVSHQGTQIAASLDSRRLIDVKDATFAEAGALGLCTFARAGAAFDDLQIRGIRPPSADAAKGEAGTGPAKKK